MTKNNNRERIVALVIAILGGFVVYFFLEKPVLSILTSIFIVCVGILFISKRLPSLISFNRAAQKDLDRIHNHLGLAATYQHQEAASRLIVDAAHSTQRLDLLLIRGHTFLLHEDALFDRMIRIKNLKIGKIRVLLLDPNGKAMQTYLERRNLSDVEKNKYLENCRRVTEKLGAIKSKQVYDLQFAYYDFFPSWKLILTDTKVFVAAYDAQRRGSQLCVALYHNMGKPYFISFSNYFETIWKKNIV